MYSFVIYLYIFGVKLAALFGNVKARELVQGHKKVFALLREKINPEDNYLWFHAASLGEFEQGRPLMEKIRNDYGSKYRILLTFFSPSGYRVRYNYQGADVVCYLPFDTPVNVRRFLDIVHPKMAFFIKYEFWQNYLKGLVKRHIPVYSISSIFDKKQVFFRWYGGTYHKVLKKFDHLFVQDEHSKNLLDTIGVNRVTVVGDTRFDRVLQVKQDARELPLVRAFCGDAPVFVAGSSWPPDEAVYIPFFHEHRDWKVVIAPHEVNEERLKEIERKMGTACVRYSQAESADNLAGARCLLIDGYGLLSSVYRCATVAYVGGGFGAGIHNLPEAAVYSVPVIFGFRNEKFKEAQDLKACGGGIQIENVADFEETMKKFISDKKQMAVSGEAAGAYIKRLSGASEKILKEINLA